MTTHQRNFPSIDPAKLERLAETAVKVGLRLQPGQDLFLTAPVAALPLARRIVAEAYKAGAGLVTPILSDEEITLARYPLRAGRELRPRAGLALRRRRQGLRRQHRAARHRRRRSDAARRRKTRPRSRAPTRPIRSPISRRWRRSPASTSTGTSSPIRPPHGRSGSFRATRRRSPSAGWRRRSSPLRASTTTIRSRPGPRTTRRSSRRTEWLNARKFHALHYSGPGTDLTIGLADGHDWQGGAATAKNGITCNPNIPTEEVFTTPHARRVDGHVASTKPLSYQGTLIDGIAVRFEAGRIVEAKASRGEDVLNKVLDTDEGARRLGEVALVPHSSPISKSGLLFFNTLFDENAACHIALGQCYAKCFVDGAKLSPEQIAAQGGNKSMIHIDWMIGSDMIDIDGLDANGARTPVFRKGEWA